jgi:hypothetical protein
MPGLRLPEQHFERKPLRAWSRDVHAHFTYHSQTQRTVHTTPFLWLICSAGWLGYTGDGADECVGILALLAFGWLFLANPLMNALVRLRGERFGPVDLSENTSPTGIERLLNGLILAAAVAAGGATAALSVQSIARLELKILIAFVIFLAVTGLIDGALTLAVILLSGFRIRPVRG